MSEQESWSNYKMFRTQNCNNSLIAVGVRGRERKIPGVFIFQFMLLVREARAKRLGETFNLVWNAPFGVPMEHARDIQEAVGKFSLKIKM